MEPDSPERSFAQDDDDESSDDDDTADTRVLRVLIKSKREALGQTRTRTQELRAGSLQLMEQLKGRETGVLREVNEGLVAHEQFEGHLQRLGRDFAGECQEARAQVTARRKLYDERIHSLRLQLTKIEAQTQATAEDIQQCVLFKEQGQFYNAKHLAAVKARMADVQSRHDTELALLENLSETGHAKRTRDFSTYFDKLKLAKADVCAVARRTCSFGVDDAMTLHRS